VPATEAVRRLIHRPATFSFLISTWSSKELSQKASSAMVAWFGIGAAAVVGGLVWGAVLLLA
jgi:hypothetical protein